VVFRWTATTWLVDDVVYWSRLQFLLPCLWSKLLLGSVKEVVRWVERGGGVTVCKGPFLAMCSFPTSLPCTEESLGVETSREAYTATGGCSPRSLGQWCDSCSLCAVGLSWWVDDVGSDVVLCPFQYIWRLDSFCWHMTCRPRTTILNVLSVRAMT